MNNVANSLDCRNALAESLNDSLRSLLWPEKCPLLEDYQALFPHAPLPFVEQDTSMVKAAGGYERFIETNKSIPTRPGNWHDYYNALSWELFPSIKTALHRSQCQFPADESANKRSPEQNGATLFDENGVVLLTQASWVESALQDHDWETLFWTKRSELIQTSYLYIVGHALWEKCRQPYIGITGKCLVQCVQPADWTAENHLETINQLIPHRCPLRSQQLLNLPLLGWPSICEANKVKSFYANTDYFRQKRI